MELKNRILIIDYNDVDTIIYHLNDGKSSKDAAKILFNISPQFEEIITEVEISAPSSDNNRKNVEMAISAIKSYLNI